MAGDLERARAPSGPGSRRGRRSAPSPTGPARPRVQEVDEVFEGRVLHLRRRRASPGCSRSNVADVVDHLVVHVQQVGHSSSPNPSRLTISSSTRGLVRDARRRVEPREQRRSRVAPLAVVRPSSRSTASHVVAKPGTSFTYSGSVVRLASDGRFQSKPSSPSVPALSLADRPMSGRRRPTSSRGPSMPRWMLTVPTRPPAARCPSRGRRGRRASGTRGRGPSSRAWSRSAPTRSLCATMQVRVGNAPVPIVACVCAVDVGREPTVACVGPGALRDQRPR